MIQIARIRMMSGTTIQIPIQPVRYLSVDGGLMSVDVGLERTTHPVMPRLLFRPPAVSRGGPYAAIDNATQAKIAVGQRFVFAVPVPATASVK
jgi:hypothetical protein